MRCSSSSPFLNFAMTTGGLFKSLLLHPVTKRHTERRIIEVTPRHLFQIIKDVDRYSEFLPLCSHSQVLRRQGPYFDATLTVGLPPLLTEKFVSRVHFIEGDELVVETKSIQSKLFDSLSSRWSLQRHSGGHSVRDETKVDFWMEMTVSDPIIVAALDRVLEEVAGRQVAAFEARCKVIPYLRNSDEQ